MTTTELLLGILSLLGLIGIILKIYQLFFYRVKDI
jgi:hypothetical protein